MYGWVTVLSHPVRCPIRVESFSEMLGMRRIFSAVTTIAALLTPCRFSSGQAPPTSMLGVRIVAAPRWVNGCLQLTVERVNITSKPIYVPNRGLFAWSSTKLLQTSSKTEAKNRWVLIHGGSDVADFEANFLPAHASIKDALFLPQTFAVVDMRRETRRQIVVRGLLKIEALYFRTEEEWTTNKTQHEEMFRLPLSK